MMCVDLACILALKCITVVTKNSEKLIRGLALRKNRKKTGLFIAEGLKLVTDFVSAGVEVDIIYHVGPIPEKLMGDRTVEVSESDMKRITFLETSSPVLAVFHQRKEDLKSFIDAPIILLLDRVQDPGNLGTLLRTALWYGVEHIALVSGTADVWSPKVVQASMSALAHVKVVLLEEQEWLSFATENKFELVIADMNGTPAKSFEWSRKQILVMGNEGQGASDMLKSSGRTITLPGDSSKMESLNVAVSGATLLYEYASSRRF